MFVLFSAACFRSSAVRLLRAYGNAMTSDISDKPALHEAVGKISWLLGKWKGEGCGVYPTISPFMYGEEIVFNHVGQPMFSYNSRTWHAENGKPMHHETGWLRIKPGTSTLAFIIAQNTGVTEIEEGEVEGHKIRLLSHTVGRMSFGAEPKVLKIERIYTLKDANTLELECFMETTNTEHQKHLHITYKKVGE
ncbi:unnamed protein product [Porites evermanni]|uniref:THAP4-like heme-binding domain-containing protein n=1 Tax=Porites evermanni TaxID=104178 RepID=A0ABN8QX00_9CNID|nr:unnamed protein product [Porites evermanni]